MNRFLSCERNETMRTPTFMALLSLLTCMGQLRAGENPVAWWRFEEGQGSITTDSCPLRLKDHTMQRRIGALLLMAAGLCTVFPVATRVAAEGSPDKPAETNRPKPRRLVAVAMHPMWMLINGT
jgi:hypothetical protein